MGRADKIRAWAEAVEMKVECLKKALAKAGTDLARKEEELQENESQTAEARKRAGPSTEALRKVEAELVFERERR